MGMFLNRGTAAFRSAIDSPIYVDKTGMIDFCNKAVGTEQRYICVSRPRRFGKTITADMLGAYYVRGYSSEGLFAGRKISECEDWKKYLNRFEVIKIDMADICTEYETVEEALDIIESTVIEEVSAAYPGIISEDTKTLASVLYKINEYSKNNKSEEIRFILIIDEWDYFFREKNCSEEIKDRYINLLRSLFKGNRSKEFIALAYITGILPIKKYNNESALNNFWEYTMTSPKRLAKYIGFNSEEVKELCEEYDMDFDKAMEWYDGYSFGNADHICGPNSVVNAMLEGEYGNYWSKTSSYNSLSTYITMNFDGLKDAIISMLAGNSVRVDVMGCENDMTTINSKDDLLTILIHLGYLGYDKEAEEAYIPNKEVRQIFEGNMKNTGWTEVIEAIDESENLLQYTIDGNEEAVATLIDKCHRRNFSIKEYNSENTLSACINLAYYTARKDYLIFRELPSGYGFADIVFIPKIPGTKPAMVVELKWNKDTETAITQIKNKKYPDALTGIKGEILLVGINYDKNNIVSGHECIIERLQPPF